MKVRVSIILGMILSFWSGVVYATTFTVTNNLNEGAGSLRWAIEQSNAEEGNSKIVFDLAAPSDTITLTELITVSSSVELDGTIAGGKVTIQGPEIETLIHCVGVPTGGNFSLTSVNFGKWKSRTTTGNNIAVMLDQIKEGGSANFSMNDVSVSGNAKSTTFVNAIDTAWFVSVDKCEIESVNAGVYYGNRAVITNSVFRNCHSTVTSSASRENILVEGCEFYGGNRTTISARYAEVLNCTFDGSAYGVYVMRPHCNVHVDACLFLRTQLHAIYSFNTSEDWHIEVENCEFYDNKRWICFMKRGYSEDFIPAPSRVLFHHNYCGITKEGEPRPNGGGVWAQIDYVDIHDNIFATDGSFHMIRDEGNDTLYVRNNYFGTNAKGVKIGGARAIYSTYIDDQVKEYMAPGRQEYKYYEDNVFYGIEDFGFKTDSIKSYVTLSRNLFIDMPDTAIIDVQKKQIPVISSAEVVEDKLIVTGVSGANSVVEIFRSSQAEQSALEYLTAVESDAEGAFTATIPIEKFGENPICLSATATYADRATSALSKVYCCEDCLLRLDRTEYYVKTSRQGKGDGSSWENAMDGKDFAFVFPQVGDGVTFYVAEGEYDLKKLSTSTDGTPTVYINSPVTIIGGYPANAEEGAVSSPATHHTWMKTGYFRLATGGDVIFDGLRFENEYNRGAFDADYYVKEGLHMILKNCVVLGNAKNDYAVYAKVKTTLENDSLVGPVNRTLVWSNDSLFVTNCYVSGSSEDGIYIHRGYVELSNSSILNNRNCGVRQYLNSEVNVFSSIISGNGNAGIHSSYGSLVLKESLIGLDVNWNSLPNKIGVCCENGSGSLLAEGNVVAANDSIGFLLTTMGTSCALYGNYVGVGKEFEDLGNGSHGICIANRTVVIFPTNLDSANYIGFNKGDGIYVDAGMNRYDISYNYIGITPDKKSMPNEGYGINISSGRGNEYLLGNVIGYNQKGGVNIAGVNGNIFVSENLFFGTEGNAIDLGGDMRNIFTPRISKIERVLDSIYIEGTTDTTFVSDIELFYTNGELQTAHKFLGRKSTTKQGEFSFVIPVETLPKNGNVCFSATATYNGQTGELTDPFCCDSCLCPTDTTLATDTLIAGVPFVDGVVYSVGRHDSIFETITLPNGCDSVVMHRLVVKPNPEVKEYYVKTTRQGTGDGSTWENAMDSIDFATYLPLAPDGATFYVAEGVYRPVYDAGLFVPKNSSSKCYTINSSVTIRGGYPADAETGAVSEPKKYLTVFDGDIFGDDVIDESLDEDGFVSIETTNTIDNASQMFLSLVPDEQSIILDGVVVKNTNSYALNILNPNKRVTLLNNSFVYNNGTVVNLPYEGDVVELRNCTFEKNIGNVFNLPNVDTLLMDNVSLVQNATLGFLSHPKKGYASINNSKFSNNGSDIQLIHYDVNISNSEFFSNKGSNVLYIVGDSSVANIRTSKFISNKSTNVVTNYGSSDLIIDSCEFVSNISEGNLIYCPNEKDVFVLTNSEIQNNEVNELIFVQNRKKVWIKNNKIKQNASNILYCNSIQDSIVVECNVISENNSQSIGLYFNGSSDCILYFDKNSVCHNVSSDNLFDFTSSFKNVFIENNTIVSNDVLTALLEFHGCPVKLYNNTIVGNVSNGVSNCIAGYYDIVGNVILGNSCKLRNGIISRNTEEIRTRWSEVRRIENNILPSIQWIDDGGYCVPIKEYMKNNIVSIYDSSDVCEEFKGIENRNEEILTSLFEGTYNLETNLFTPVLADNGGFTPTVALKSDRLPDGTSIRFPLSETTVTTDQRGVARLEQTCMGAYELECTADTTFATDTIVVGEKFLGEVYAIGRHDSIFETIALPNGCDSVVMHTLIVKPDPKVLNYYVKTERWGAGDGSSWEDAMDGDDFIFMLPQVGDGVTFHVAEGRYMKEGNALSNKINSSVKIIGGYEAEAKTGAVSDPKKYHTVFETLPDKYGYGFSNLCFYELTNTESVVELSNLDLSHSGVRGKAGKLVVDSCSFYDCYLTLDVAVDTLIVSNSYFGKISEEARLYNGINHIRQQGKFASISACTFEGNSSSSLGIRMIDISASGAAHIENCTFANLYNRSTGYQITLASSNDTAFFVNNTVVGNIHQSSFSFTNVAFIGNIIAGSSSSLKDGKILKSEYNLVGEGSSLSNSDKDVNSSDLVEILNGTYDASTGLFTPVLADNGGFTPTVALKSDRLPDGTSIRFPLSETTVATDQRGVERFPLTCKGAYELEYDTSDCEIGTIIFKEDFGGNYLSDPDFGQALPNGLTTLMYGDNLVPYNGYSLRKEALKRNITNCNDFSNVNKHIYCGWYADFDDHTSEGDFNRGYFMQIDMNRNKTIFYTITINDLCEHTHLNLLMWVHPVNSSDDSELILSVEDLSGNVLASEAFVVESSVNEWSKISIPFTVPLNQTSIVYKIYSEADSYGGDIAIDDIEVRLCKPAVSVNAPEDYLCASSDYKLTATYGNKGGYIEPVNYTWFKNSEPSYEIEGWTKVSEGKELQLENISSDAYYRCVISSAGVEGLFDKCNSASDIIPVLLGGLNDTSFVADTILTGEIYNGNQYFEVGTFDGIVETIHRDGSCDSIVLHELHVVREDFCSLATLSSNPITKSSDYLQFTSSYPRDLKFTIMDKEGNIVCKTVERTYGAGEHKVSLFKLFGIDKRDFDPLTPYILVVSSGNDLFMTYIYISWM